LGLLHLHTTLCHTYSPSNPKGEFISKLCAIINKLVKKSLTIILILIFFLSCERVHNTHSILGTWSGYWKSESLYYEVTFDSDAYLHYTIWGGFIYHYKRSNDTIWVNPRDTLFDNSLFYCIEFLNRDELILTSILSCDTISRVTNSNLNFDIYQVADSFSYSYHHEFLKRLYEDGISRGLYTEEEYKKILKQIAEFENKPIPDSVLKYNNK